MQLAQWGVETWALALGIDFSINSPPIASPPIASPPIASPPIASPPNVSKNLIFDKTRIIAIFAVLIFAVLIFAVLIFAVIRGTIKSEPNPEKEPNRSPSPEKIISANEARNWLGEVVTVRVLIKSTHDGFDWGFLINSEEDFRNENNFTTVVDKATAGAIYNNKGGVNLNQYFKKNMVILVKGEVETYDRKSNVRYQIKVTDPNQITVEK